MLDVNIALVYPIFSFPEHDSKLDLSVLIIRRRGCGWSNRPKKGF